MFTFIKDLYKKLTTVEEIVEEDKDKKYLEEMQYQLELLNQNDFGKINLPKLGTHDKRFEGANTETNPHLKNVLIVDDLEDIDVVYKTAFNRIQRSYKKNVYKDFNVYITFEPNCGAVAFNFLKENRIDYAILDITLGYLTRLNNGQTLTIDGIDLAVEIWKRYPQSHICFSTVHTCNQKNPTVAKYFKKFNKLTGKHLDDYYIEKNDPNLHSTLETFLYKEVPWSIG